MAAVLFVCKHDLLQAHLGIPLAHKMHVGDEHTSIIVARVEGCS